MRREPLYKIYWKLQSLIVPKLKYSQRLYEDVLQEWCPRSEAWLDLGCGRMLLPEWRFEREKELVAKAKFIVGLDFDQWSLTQHKTIGHCLRGDASALPFPDNTFDLMTSNMVFEHLDNPEVQLREIHRVLTPGGTLIFHTPSTKGYFAVIARMIPEKLKAKLVYLLQGRKEEDLFPAHYKINSPKRVQELARASGLSVHKIRMICTSASSAMIPPLVILELLWIRFLMTPAGRPLRTNMIVFLRKEAN